MLRAGPAAPTADDEAVWHLPPVPLFARAEARAQHERVRSAVFSAFAAIEADVYLRSAEEPTAATISQYLQEEGPREWRLRKASRVWELRGPELDLGGWLLYSAPRPIEGEVPDTFRVENAVFRRLLRDNGVRLLVDSFHDNTEWIIALGGK